MLSYPICGKMFLSVSYREPNASPRGSSSAKLRQNSREGTAIHATLLYGVPRMVIVLFSAILSEKYSPIPVRGLSLLCLMYAPFNFSKFSTEAPVINFARRRTPFHRPLKPPAKFRPHLTCCSNTSSGSPI